MMLHGYTHLEVKSIDVEQRILTGIASTPRVDRQGHSLDPMGAQFAASIPLLLHHDQKQPVGTVTLTATPEGLAFRAEIPQVTDPGPLKDRLDETFQAVKAGLLKAVSIGYRVLEGGAERLANGLMRFKKTEICEVSLTTMPVNPDAVILSVKSLPPELYAVTPLPVRPGAETPMTIAERITALENSRAAKVGQLQNLMTKAQDENVTVAGGPDAETYDALEVDVKNIDADLARYRTLDDLNQKQAKPVSSTSTTPRYTQVQVKANVEPGTAFIRYVQAKAFGRGDSMKELSFASQWRDSTPEVELVLKAAVAAGNTTDATWAGPLAALKPLSDEFLALLRPQTYLGRIPGFMQVPFGVSVPAQTGGGTYSWVGEGAPKPVTKAQFGSIVLNINKCAGIIVITEELAKVSSPSAEAVIRREMIEGIGQFLDKEFIDPTKAPSTSSPGSVTNGVTPITSAGTSTANARTDIQALISAMTAAGISASRAALIMSESNAVALSGGVNALGQTVFPGLNVTGGTVMGVPVYPSQNASSNVVLIAPDCILYADDGGVTIDVSREASVQMDSAPANPADATTVFTSLWQSNYVGLRAERFITWKKARTGCVQYTVQTYVA